jgi:hypothetical protein
MSRAADEKSNPSKSKRRSWRKLHIGIDAGSDEIVAFDLTDKEVDDASHVEPLLDGASDRCANFVRGRWDWTTKPPAKASRLKSAASAPLVAFTNLTISGCPTAALRAATTTSNGLEDVTLNRLISTLLIVMFSFLPSKRFTRQQHR